MYKFKLNGKEIVVGHNMNLMDYLRDYEDLTSVKDGCSQGACGTCSILVDGRSMRACIFTIERVNGKEVYTVEGLSQREKSVYSYAFAESGAVQCGFCIPGMIISAKALIDTNPNPDRIDVKKAIRANICRCTGYQKIEDAILLSAKMFRENTEAPVDITTGEIGVSSHKVDAVVKALGEATYVDDMKFEEMVYGKALRAKYPRAKLLSINIDMAKAHPDTIDVFTAEDIDGKRYIGHLKKDQSTLVAIGEETRYLGDSIALVVAKTKKALEEILPLIEVEYEELIPMLSTEAAMAKDAPHIHEGGNILSHEVLKRGDAKKAIELAAFVVTNKYSTPAQEHAFLEAETAIGMPEADGVRVFTSSQGTYDEKKEIAELTGLPEEKVRISSAYIGGGFGGKEDMSVQHHAGFLAFKTGRIVKVSLTRDESLQIHPKRHPAEMEFTSACDKDGNLLALKATIIADTGSFASLGGPVLQRACTHAGGPYNYQNIDIEGKAVYTNNPPSGAFRGFGVTQSAFAIESNLTMLAEKVGMDPWEFRYKNAIRPGQVLPNGQIADEGTAMVETLEAIKDDYYRYKDMEGKYVGVASAMKNAGLGVGVPDFGRCRIIYEDDGRVHIHSAAADIGQGSMTVLMHMFCQTTGLPKEMVVVELPDTNFAPDSGTTTASRQTAISGEACRLASEKFKKAMEESSLEEIIGREFYAEYAPVTDRMGSDKEFPVSHLSYGYATQMVVLDDEGKLEKVYAAHDVGRAINPKGVEGQIEGGVAMGLGYALTEDFTFEGGKPTKKFGTIGLFRATDMPEVKSYIIEKNSPNEVAFGAKGIGEITCCPPAPAVQAAYYKKDGIFRTKLPMEDTFYKKTKK